MLLDFARSFTDAANAHLAEPALKRQILGDAEAPVNLHRAVDNFEAVLTRDQFGDGGFSAEWLAPVGFCRRIKNQQFGGADIDLVLHQHPLDTLAMRQGRAEGFTNLGVFNRHFMRLDSNAETFRRIGHALERQAVISNGKPTTFLTKNIFMRHPQILELDFRCVFGGA